MLDDPCRPKQVTFAPVSASDFKSAVVFDEIKGELEKVRLIQILIVNLFFGYCFIIDLNFYIFSTYKGAYKNSLRFLMISRKGLNMLRRSTESSVLTSKTRTTKNRHGSLM